MYECREYNCPLRDSCFDIRDQIEKIIQDLEPGVQDLFTDKEMVTFVSEEMQKNKIPFCEKNQKTIESLLEEQFGQEEETHVGVEELRYLKKGDILIVKGCSGYMNLTSGEEVEVCEDCHPNNVWVTKKNDPNAGRFILRVGEYSFRD